MPLQLISRICDSIPTVVEGVLPHTVAGRTLSEIGQMPVWRGNRQVALASCFEVAGNASDFVMHWKGRLDSVMRLGTGLAGGTLVVHGDAGDHLGARMVEGQIIVHGSSGDWTGAEMQGGLIRIHGNTTDFCGAAYQGSPRGMQGGTLLVEGNAGQNTGAVMRRGLLAIGGNCGHSAGRNMLAGTLVVVGSAGRYYGCGMKRGTLIQLGVSQSAHPTDSTALLPTFAEGYCGHPPGIHLVLRELLRLDFPMPQDALQYAFTMYHGDPSRGNRGEVFRRHLGSISQRGTR